MNPKPEYIVHEVELNFTKTHGGEDKLYSGPKGLEDLSHALIFGSHPSFLPSGSREPAALTFLPRGCVCLLEIIRHRN